MISPAPTALGPSRCPRQPIAKRFSALAMGRRPPRCPARPLSDGVRPLERVCLLSRGFGGVILSSGHGGQVASEAVPDPNRTSRQGRVRRGSPTFVGCCHSPASFHPICQRKLRVMVGRLLPLPARHLTALHGDLGRDRASGRSRRGCSIASARRVRYG